MFVYTLLIVMETLQSRVGFAQKAQPSTSNTPHFETYVRRMFVNILLIVMESLSGKAHLIKKWVRDSSNLHQVAGRMPGIETNTDQLACLVAQIETEALECASASCSWVCPAGGKLAGLMRDIVPSHLCDERTDISSMGFEPPVVKDMKPHDSSYQQEESSAKR